MSGGTRGLLTTGALPLVLLLATLPGPAIAGWQLLEPGLEFGEFELPQRSTSGDSKLRVLRVDLDRFELQLATASSSTPPSSRTAREWSRARGWIAAINASMFQEDYRTSVSLMRTRDHVNNAYLSRDRTVLGFDPRSPDVPPARLIDRDCDDLEEWSARYGTLIQSIRMLSCDGRNVWKQRERAYSTAALGFDERGRILFFHVRSPYSTHDLIENLRQLPLGLKRAMYLEGGPEAQLFVTHGEREWEFGGSLGLGAWRVPNVIGLARREAPLE